MQSCHDPSQTSSWCKRQVHVFDEQYLRCGNKGSLGLGGDFQPGFWNLYLPNLEEMIGSNFFMSTCSSFFFFFCFLCVGYNPQSLEYESTNPGFHSQPLVSCSLEDHHSLVVRRWIDELAGESHGWGNGDGSNMFAIWNPCDMPQMIIGQHTAKKTCFNL